MIWSQNPEAQKHNQTPEQRQAIEEAVQDLTWANVQDIKTLPMSQGLALKGIVKCVGGDPVAFAWDGILWGSYSLLGLKTEYAQGLVTSYWLDDGLSATSLAYTDFE